MMFAMDFALLHPADQLALLMNRIYQGGMTTTSDSNLNILYKTKYPDFTLEINKSMLLTLICAAKN
jgi:hypothetical protein